MGIWLLPVGAIAAALALSQLPRDGEKRRRLRLWLWVTPAIWLAIVTWGYLYFDPMHVAPTWVSNVLALAVPIQAAAVLATVVRTTSRSTRLYVIPFIVFVCIGSAYAWLHVWMALKHSWF